MRRRRPIAVAPSRAPGSIIGPRGLLATAAFAAVLVSPVLGGALDTAAAASMTPGGPAGALQADAAADALRSGRYEDAADAYRARLQETGAADAAVGLARALMAVGEYDGAESVARDWQADHPGSAELATTLGEVLWRTGRPAEAEEAFQRAVSGGVADRLTAEVGLGVLAFEAGRRDEAMQRFDRFIDYYNDGTADTADELVAVGIACRYLGIGDHRLFQDAILAFDQALEADPSNLEARLRMGELFLEKYQSGEADGLLSEVLEINPRHPDALVAMARRLDFDGEPEAAARLDEALEVNPRHVPARVLRARLLLTRERYDEAAAEAERALDVNPASLDAMSMLAAARFLQRDATAFETLRNRVLERNPRYGDLFGTLADLAVANRLYGRAVEFARRAVEVDPQNWQGYGQLGLNLLRVGDIEAGRENLETAFEGDPHNVWIKNTLDLLDTFPDYVTSRTEHFELMIEEPEAELLGLYMGRLADEAYESLAARYDHRPPTPVRLEVYPSHDDFSVRTVGLAGLGALGVSFGPVIAMDSPSARPAGDLNWGSTLWHEVGHTITLGTTDHRIPRWLSEGLSVYEERRARPGWGDDVTPDFLLAHLQERLLPVSRLTEGFVRPRYPRQVVHSYYQASLVCELVEERWGFDALLAILEGYRQGGRTEEVFERTLQIDMGELDRLFVTWLEARFAGPLGALAASAEGLGEAPQGPAGGPPDPALVARQAREHPDDYLAQLRHGALLFGEGRHDEAVPRLEKAKELFPAYTGADSPYWLLASIARDRGDLERAEAELSAMVASNERHYEAHVQLAEVRLELGDPAGAAEALERSLYIWPLEMDVHRRLAGLYGELERHDEAIREWRAVVALEPTDRAEAFYRLARALLAGGRPDEAKSAVLSALEIAPGYAEAQDLLLELIGSDTETSRPAPHTRRHEAPGRPEA